MYMNHTIGGGGAGMERRRDDLDPPPSANMEPARGANMMVISRKDVPRDYLMPEEPLFSTPPSSAKESTPSRDSMMDLIRLLLEERRGQPAQNTPGTTAGGGRTRTLGGFRSKPGATGSINARRRAMSGVTPMGTSSDTAKVHEIGRKQAIARNVRRGRVDEETLRSMGATEDEIVELMDLAESPALPEQPGPFRRGSGPTREDAMRSYGQYERNKRAARADEVYINSRSPDQGVPYLTENQRDFANRYRTSEGKTPLKTPRSPRDLMKPGYANRNPEIPGVIRNAVGSVPTVDDYIERVMSGAGGGNLPMPPVGTVDHYRSYASGM